MNLSLAPWASSNPSRFPELAGHLRAMRAMLGVVRHGSTTRAAQAMHLSQPAVARSVLQLEEACGMPLFMRGARGMMPTPLGSQLAARIEAMLQHLGSGAADLLTAMPEQHRFIRGMVAWLGGRQIPLLYDREERFAGTSKYPLRRMLRILLDA